MTQSARRFFTWILRLILMRSLLALPYRFLLILLALAQRSQHATTTSLRAVAYVAVLIWLSSHFHEAGLVGLIAALVLTAWDGVLMVSRFSFPSFKQFNLDKRVKFVYILIVPLFFVLISLDPPAMLL